MQKTRMQLWCKQNLDTCGNLHIPDVKVKKATEALKKDDIRTTKLKVIEWKYVHGLGQ